MKKIMKVTTIILVVLSLCVACGEKNVVKTIEKMYDDGIERVQKAKDAKDVQKIYDDVTQKVKDVKNMHLKEFAELDSTTNTLQKSEETFVKACCIKIRDKGALLKTPEGVISIDENGTLFRSWDSKQNNPLAMDIVDYIPIYEYNKNDKRWYLKEIRLRIPGMDYMYDDEDADLYYDDYAFTFYIAYNIAMDAANDDVLRDYIKLNLMDIMSNIPLDASYPEKIREYVNKEYYDYKEKKVYRESKGYGYVKYLFYIEVLGKSLPCNFYLRRGENGLFGISKYR